MFPSDEIKSLPLGASVKNSFSKKAVFKNQKEARCLSQETEGAAIFCLQKVCAIHKTNQKEFPAIKVYLS